MISFIYVIGATDSGPVKIGFSKDPERRLRQLQTGHSETLRIFHSEPIEDNQVLLMEQRIHWDNRHRKCRGEWFDLTVADAILEVRHAMIRHENEVATKARNKLL